MATKLRQSTITISSRHEEVVEGDDDVSVLPLPDGRSKVLGSEKGNGKGRIRIDRGRLFDDNPKPPAWVSTLVPSFQFVGFGNPDKRGRKPVELTCSLCASDPTKKKSNFKGREVTYFTNHLKVSNKTIVIVRTFEIHMRKSITRWIPFPQVFHKEAHDRFLKAKSATPSCEPSSGNINTHYPRKSKNTTFSLNDDEVHDEVEEQNDEAQNPVSSKYTRDHPKQIQFEAILTQALVTDSAPFQTVDNPGFRMLIEFLDRNLSVPTRNTFVKRIESKYEQVSPLTVPTVYTNSLQRTQ